MKINFGIQNSNKNINFSSLRKIKGGKALSRLMEKEKFPTAENPLGSINLSRMTHACKRYIDYAKTSGRYVEDFGGTRVEFKDCFHPYTLPVVRFPKSTMHISNFVKPNGTIAITSSSEETISTDGLLQCAALSIVDKNRNLQTLLHCCPNVDAKENRVILDYIFSHCKNSAPEVTIVPGRYEETDSAISFLVDNIRDILGKFFKINFANIAKDHESIILKDGKLACAKNGRRLLKHEINPADRIIFNNPFVKIKNGTVEFIWNKLLPD